MMSEISSALKRLVKARMEFGPLVKKRVADAGKYSYEYANLADVYDLCLPVLIKYDLYLFHEVRGDNLLTSIVDTQSNPAVTILSSNSPLRESAYAQDYGADLSYKARYAAKLMLTLADIDVEEAVEKSAKKITEAQAQELLSVSESFEIDITPALKSRGISRVLDIKASEWDKVKENLGRIVRAKGEKYEWVN